MNNAKFRLDAQEKMLDTYASLIAHYEGSISYHHRQQYRQVFTPLQIAMFMARWVLHRGATVVFDPALGLGAFYFVSAYLNPSITYIGLEKDDTILKSFVNYTGGHFCSNLSVHSGNYFMHWGNQYQGIICNPPYMRFQHFIERHQVIPRLEIEIGCKLSGYLNASSAFLIKSLCELAPGGCLAYLMPLEFLNTGYGTIVKKLLLDRRCLKALIRIEPEAEVFPEVVTSVGMVLVADTPDSLEPIKFCTVSNLDLLQGNMQDIPGKLISPSELNPDDKWLVHFETLAPIKTYNYLLSNYGSFVRGIATGANKFFVLSQEEANAHRLPRNVLVPCISRSPQITQPIISDTYIDSLITSNQRVLLLNLHQSENNDAVQRYIYYGEKQGFHQRFLTKSKKPWYRTEHRQPAPILLSVFSRNRFKVVRNVSQVLSLTCYHCFYPNYLGQQFIEHLFLYLYSEIGQATISTQIRKYGNNLNKFEPSDLNNARCPSPQQFLEIPNTVVQAHLALLEQKGFDYSFESLL